jgi:hypothetical protein
MPFDDAAAAGLGAARTLDPRNAMERSGVTNLLVPPQCMWPHADETATATLALPDSRGLRVALNPSVQGTYREGI